MTVNELIVALQEQVRLGCGEHIAKIGTHDGELLEVGMVTEVFGEGEPTIALQEDF